MEPSDIHATVESAFRARDVDALVALYEPDAWFFSLTGPVQGLDAIRTAWEAVFEMGGEDFALTTQYAIEQGDLALLSNTWSLTVGGETMSATTAEVARRQADGTWKYVIDNPDAAGLLA